MRHAALALALALAALAGCASPGWTRRSPGPDLDVEPVDPDLVEVLVAAPEGAQVLGEVRGVEWRGTALDDARRRAADLGADAIVPTARGDQGTGFMWSLPFVDCVALRIR